ncbi:MAG TPA: FtsX-like permease family protein, partial [Planctomycetota bacterium]|nr:FtsX-like permease family protein [Planctomycetota bacterium]
TVKQELFGSQSPLGEFVRLGNRRYRVAGVLASEGMSLGTNLDEMVVLPVGAAQALFNSPGLLRIIIEAKSREAVAQVVTDTERIITERHEGENDVTVVTQDAIASGFDGVLRALTMAVAGIGAISLVVAGILIMNVMVVAVTQRRSEVGLLKALGAERPTIRGLFLGEALLLSLGGSLLGLLLGEGCSRLVPRFVPMLQPGVPAWAAVMALVTAVLFGVVFGISPAVRAARLDPVLALARR